MWCKDCGQVESGYDTSNDYDPECDDYFLGRSSYHLDWCWANENFFHCFDCEILISTSKMGHGTAIITPPEGLSHAVGVKFCQGCYRGRKGLRLEKEYEGRLDDLIQRTDRWLEDHPQER